MRPTVLIIDPADAVRQRLAAAALTWGFVLAGECRSLAEGIIAFARELPDIVILDPRIQEELIARDAVRIMLEIQENIRFVICGECPDPEVLEMMSAVQPTPTIHKPFHLDEALELFKALEESYPEEKDLSWI